MLLEHSSIPHVVDTHNVVLSGSGVAVGRDPLVFLYVLDRSVELQSGFFEGFRKTLLLSP